MLEVILGPMFSGKTTEMIRRVNLAKLAGLKTVILKPHIDTRCESTKTSTHDDQKADCVVVGRYGLDAVLDAIGDASVVGFDEVQFCDEEVINTIKTLSRNGLRIVVAGLDMDFAGHAFTVPAILCAHANKVRKFAAVCVKCGQDATMSFRKQTDVAGAGDASARVAIGGKESYEARCLSCWKMGQSHD